MADLGADAVRKAGDGFDAKVDGPCVQCSPDPEVLGQTLCLPVGRPDTFAQIKRKPSCMSDLIERQEESVSPGISLDGAESSAIEDFRDRAQEFFDEAGHLIFTHLAEANHVCKQHRDDPCAEAFNFAARFL